jgi:hypothetical protein
VQTKLRDQAHSLSERMKARQLAGASEEFKAFTADMDEAVKAMAPAADKLRGSQWQNALAPEEKALQHLLRAEAVMRDIKVAFGNRGAAGGGAASGAERDLQSLFDLELDTEKNQYESGQSSASKDQRQREIDEALQKLEQLARRQQELAEQQRRNQQVSQQRWQQEMLRREAEELQRKMEQLSRNQQGQQSGQQQSGQQQSAQPQSGQPQSGQQSGQSGRQSSQGGQMSSQQLQRAIDQLKQAQQDMRQSTSNQREGDAQRAAERLKDARDSLAGLRQQQAAGSVDDLARQADDIANRQQESNAKLRRAFGAPGQQQAQGATRQQTEELAREKEQLANDYQRLESQMGTVVRDTQATNRQLSSKLRDALGQVQQNEINNRLRWTTDHLRREDGAVATMRDAVTTQALNNLRDQLHEIQKSLGNGQPGAGDKDRQALEQALAETERLRKEMERGMQSGRQGRGLPSRDRQGAAPQPGKQDGQQLGQQPGQQPGQSQSAQPGDGQPGGQIGPRANGRQDGLLPGLGPTFGDTGDFLGDYRHTLRELGNNPQIGKDLRDRINDLYRLDPQMSPGNPELMNRIESQMLTGVEQIELLLRRQLDEQGGGAVRSGSAEPVPQGYADAVAEYFRRLSKEK